MKILIKIIVLALFVPSFIYAQISKDRDVVSSAGNYSTTPTLNVSWTVGEPAILYSQNPGLIVNEGFQQSDVLLSGVEEVSFAGDFKVYPNPVEHILNFEISTDNEITLHGELFDVNGRRIMEIQDFSVLAQYQGTIDFSQLAAGEWFLRFLDAKGDAVKTFTIIKVK